MQPPHFDFGSRFLILVPFVPLGHKRIAVIIKRSAKWRGKKGGKFLGESVHSDCVNTVNTGWSSVKPEVFFSPRPSQARRNMSAINQVNQFVVKSSRRVKVARKASVRQRSMSRR